MGSPDLPHVAQAGMGASAGQPAASSGLLGLLLTTAPQAARRGLVTVAVSGHAASMSHLPRQGAGAGTVQCPPLQCPPYSAGPSIVRAIDWGGVGNGASKLGGGVTVKEGLWPGGTLESPICPSVLCPSHIKSIILTRPMWASLSCQRS